MLGFERMPVVWFVFVNFPKKSINISFYAIFDDFFIGFPSIDITKRIL
jgi:hypothetical protein